LGNSVSTACGATSASPDRFQQSFCAKASAAVVALPIPTSSHSAFAGNAFRVATYGTIQPAIAAKSHSELSISTTVVPAAAAVAETCQSATCKAQRSSGVGRRTRHVRKHRRSTYSRPTHCAWDFCQFSWSGYGSSSRCTNWYKSILLAAGYRLRTGIRSASPRSDWTRSWVRRWVRTAKCQPLWSQAGGTAKREPDRFVG